MNGFNRQPLGRGKNPRPAAEKRIVDLSRHLAFQSKITGEHKQ
jgi:hypothetical protein